jgi:hypothetical protein
LRGHVDQKEITESHIQRWKNLEKAIDDMYGTNFLMNEQLIMMSGTVKILEFLNNFKQQKMFFSDWQQ